MNDKGGLGGQTDPWPVLQPTALISRSHVRAGQGEDLTDAGNSRACYGDWQELWKQTNFLNCWLQILCFFFFHDTSCKSVVTTVF